MHRTIVVVGSGLAGFSAALEAAAASSVTSKILLLEKTAVTGGNSAKATSGINGCRTLLQARKNIDDTCSAFVADTLQSGSGGHCDERLVSTLCDKSADAVHWVCEQTGLDIGVIAQLGGHSVPRTHRTPDDPKTGAPVPVGFSVMSKLRKLIEEKHSGKITIMTNTTVTGLITKKQQQQQQQSDATDDEAEAATTTTTTTTTPTVTGVKIRRETEIDTFVSESAEDHQLDADAVILATGGYSNDHSESSLLAEFAPDLVNVPTTNGAFATGDGVKMAREIGATLRDMDKVQLHPTGFIDPRAPNAATKYLGPEALRGSGGILLAPSGERFVNELGLRSHVSAAIKALGNDFPGSNGLPFAYCVLNAAAAQQFGIAHLAFYKDRAKVVSVAHSVGELARLMGGADADVLRATIAEHAALTQQTQSHGNGNGNGNGGGNNNITDNESNESNAKTSPATPPRACPRTGKTVFPCAWAVPPPVPLAEQEPDQEEPADENVPYYVCAVTTVLHYTMGGVQITDSAEVVDAKTQKPIRGLFAAGEVTCGVHGGNRLAGNSLLECVVFGRVAGANAAKYVASPPEK